MAIGQTQVAMNVGGAVSNGPPAGIYHAKVTDVQTGTSNKKGTPYVQLTFQGTKKDKEHPTYAEKTILKQKFYGPNPSTDKETQKRAAGMLKRNLFKSLNKTWPESSKPFDPRIFQGVECFILVGEGKPTDEGDAFAEVKRMALDRKALEKYVTPVAGEKKAEGGEEPAAEGEQEAEQPAAKSRR
ncbi:MAG: hypothetical protein KGI71_05695 [Patescibacteria group bacterium]|nr:hypothetical protein [Patescibacteria group bacterium]